MSDQYLTRRGKGWSFRLAIPADLKGKFKSAQGKPLTHVVIGLATDSLAEARLSRDKLVAEWRVNFERARKGLELSVSEIEEQAREVYLSKLETMADAAERGRAPEIDPSNGEEHSTQQERQIKALDIALEQYIEAQESGDFSIQMGEGYFSPIAADLAAVQRRTKVTLDPNSPTYRIVSEALLSANIAALAGRIRMLRGEASEPPVTFLGSTGIDPVLLQPVAGQKVGRKPARGQGNSLRFSEAVSLWVAELKRDPNATLRASTLWYYEKICSIFVAKEHDPKLEMVTRKVAANFLSTVGEERELSNRTLRQYANILGGFFKWARKTGRYEGENPFAEQSFKTPSNTEYLPFNDDELESLFSGPLFQKLFKEALAWVALIGLYSGMRLNEIAQLWVGDIKKEHGIWVFDLREGEGQRLKTEAATRKVPIHSELMKAGLLDYVKSLPKDGRLFPDLTGTGYDHKLGRNLSLQFTRYRRKLKINRNRLCFHSLRKNVGTALDRAGMPASDREALLGHSRGFSLDVYSTGPGLKRLKDMVQTIDYPTVPKFKG